MHGRFARRLVSGLVLCVVSSAAGCAAIPPSPRDQEAADRWTERAQLVLDDPDGLGAAGGGTPGSVQYEIDRSGDWVVHAACEGAEVLRLRVRAGTEDVASTDVLCGTTARLPVHVVAGSPLRLEMTTPEETGARAVWWASVSTPEWEPGAVRFS